MCKKLLDYISMSSKDTLYICAGAISNTKPNHLRWCSMQCAQIVEIGVFGYNRIALTSCKGPNINIGGTRHAMKGNMT